MLFIYSQAINNDVISNGKSYCCNDTFTYMTLESAFYWLFCLKFSFKLVTFSKSYVRKQKWVFFLNTVYTMVRRSGRQTNTCSLLTEPSTRRRC